MYNTAMCIILCQHCYYYVLYLPCVCQYYYNIMYNIMSILLAIWIIILLCRILPCVYNNIIMWIVCMYICWLKRLRLIKIKLMTIAYGLSRWFWHGQQVGLWGKVKLFSHTHSLEEHSDGRPLIDLIKIQGYNRLKDTLLNEYLDPSSRLVNPLILTNFIWTNRKQSNEVLKWNKPIWPPRKNSMNIIL